MRVRTQASRWHADYVKCITCEKFLKFLTFITRCHLKSVLQTKMLHAVPKQAEVRRASCLRKLLRGHIRQASRATLNLGPGHSSCPSCRQQSAGSAATPSQNHARAASITSHPSLARPVEKRSPVGGHHGAGVSSRTDGRQPPAGEGPGFRCPLAGNQAEPGQLCQAPLLMPGVGSSCLQAGVCHKAGWTVAR